MHNVAGVLLVDEDRTSNFLSERLLRRLAPVIPPLLAVQNFTAGLHLLHQIVPPVTAVAADPWLVFLDAKEPGLQDFEFLAAYWQLAYWQLPMPSSTQSWCCSLPL
ncbi:hypothetical protein [Hymenobacter sp. GOD-10R]|uniref:hypothetical protein n=1 Tax=Hymenobacter sp. GOD-10R TaxID=3093922 RepID=UPI002D78D116|nr:hypothetical protein [Hymenobacter sp. GOD-10R]WRQ31111.1 hypothetical protein SD425_12665 [Hymenobacter sp. GOD-10R]